jgi:hypothetical protein
LKLSGSQEPAGKRSQEMVAKPYPMLFNGAGEASIRPVAGAKALATHSARKGIHPEPIPEEAVHENDEIFVPACGR